MIVKIYQDNPNSNEINKVADRLRDGAIAIVPTDTLYAFVCSMEFKKSVETIARLKGFTLKKAKYSMLCADLSSVSDYQTPETMSAGTFYFRHGCQQRGATQLPESQ